jgi:hypothetical protein
MAVYLLTLGITFSTETGAAAVVELGDDEMLFGKGQDVEKRFGKCFHEMLKLMEENELDELRRYGIKPGDLGTHSNRKGCASYIASMIQGPSGIAMFLRYASFAIFMFLSMLYFLFLCLFLEPLGL